MAADTGNANDFMAMGKQFWDTWTQFAQGAGSGQTPTWGDPMQVFAQAAPASGSEAFKAVESLGEQGRRFLEFMQSAAARMGAGDTLSSPDVASLWRRAFSEGNPMLDAVRAAAGEGSRGFEQLARDVQPMLQQLGGDWSAALGTPAFGYSREKQERLQAILRAQAEHAETTAAYNGLLLKASQRGNEYFENKLAERSEPGRQIDSAKALYDLWVDAAEEAYAEIALSPEFRKVYGAMVNAQMRLRLALQKELEQHASALGMPTRSELDGSHRKMHELQRELRALRRELMAVRTSPVAQPASNSGAATASAKPQVVATRKKQPRAAEGKATAATSPRSPARSATATKPVKAPAAAAQPRTRKIKEA